MSCIPSEILKVEVAKSCKEFQQNKSSDIPDDKAFSYILLTYFFDMKNFDDKYDCITDGANDGGVDFLYFDEEERKNRNSLYASQNTLKFHTAI